MCPPSPHSAVLVVVFLLRRRCLRNLPRKSLLFVGSVFGGEGGRRDLPWRFSFDRVAAEEWRENFFLPPCCYGFLDGRVFFLLLLLLLWGVGEGRRSPSTSQSLTPTPHSPSSPPSSSSSSSFHLPPQMEREVNGEGDSPMSSQVKFLIQQFKTGTANLSLLPLVESRAFAAFHRNFRDTKSGRE